MQLEDLRSFERLAQLLHFGRAARSLGMSPSALTRRMQALEEEAGVILLARGSRQVSLTTAGQRFRDFARTTLDHWEELKNQLSERQESPEGDLHIACTVTACHTVLPRLLALCRERYPRLTLRLITQDAARSLAALESREVDLAVIPTDQSTAADLEVCELARTELIFIGPATPGPEPPDLPSHRSWKDHFRAAPVVAPLAGLERERLDEFLVRHDIHAPIAAEVRGNEGIIALVSLGGGIGMVPRLVLDASSMKVRVLSEIPAPPGYCVSLCARHQSLRRDAVRVFWALAQEVSNSALSPQP